VGFACWVAVLSQIATSPAFQRQRTVFSGRVVAVLVEEGADWRDVSPRIDVALPGVEEQDFNANFATRRGSFNAGFNARLLLRPVGPIPGGPVGVEARPTAARLWGIPQIPKRLGPRQR
jgi:hypothetical protein